MFWSKFALVVWFSILCLLHLKGVGCILVFGVDSVCISIVFSCTRSSEPIDGF